MADKGEFGAEEAGSLVENNMIVFVGTPVLEAAFEYSLRSVVDFEQDWTFHAVRLVLVAIAYNILKYWSLLQRDAKGRTRIREFGAWLWVKLLGE